MNIQEIYKPGFVLFVKSWENDGDYRNTKAGHFEDYETAASVAAFLEELESSNCTNVYDEVPDAAYEIAKKHKDILLAISGVNADDYVSGEDWFNLAQDVVIYDLLGFSENYSIRVVDSVKIVHVVAAEVVEV